MPLRSDGRVGAAHPGELLERFRSDIDPEWIEEALEATGTATIRRRRLPAEQVIWLVLGMGIYRNKPITEIVAELDLALPGRRGPRAASSSVTQARERLGDEPIRWLFERSAEVWAHRSARRYAWRGLAVYGVDGTTVRLPDSDANREHFGCCVSCRGESAYPMARLVTLMHYVRTYSQLLGSARNPLARMPLPRNSGLSSRTSRCASWTATFSRRLC